MKKIGYLLVLIVVFYIAGCNQAKKTDQTATDTTTVVTNTVQPEIPNTLSTADSTAGWHLLFDGTTSAGWRGYNKKTFPEKGWEVVDGTIHCIGSGAGEAGGGGDIISEKQYKDFELALEWKISRGGNSGIFILAQEKPKHPIFESAPEMQILDNENHPDAKLGENGNRQAGSLYDLIPAVPQNAKPVGEWNKVRILVYQGTVVFFQNDAKVLEFHLWTQDWNDMIKKSKFKDWNDFINTGGPDKKGYIGLQDHGNDVWFRNIKIKEM